MSKDQLRQPAGTPIGGQYASDPNASNAAPIALNPGGDTGVTLTDILSVMEGRFGTFTDFRAAQSLSDTLDGHIAARVDSTVTEIADLPKQIDVNAEILNSSETSGVDRGRPWFLKGTANLEWESQTGRNTVEDYAFYVQSISNARRVEEGRDGKISEVAPGGWEATQALAEEKARAHEEWLAANPPEYAPGDRVAFTSSRRGRCEGTVLRADNWVAFVKLDDFEHAVRVELESAQIEKLSAEPNKGSSPAWVQPTLF